ncbi:MAG: SRPBCC family protein [Acidimicrobiia bacterium]
MRFADNPTADVDVLVDAPPAAIWPLVSEISTPARFSSELQEANWQDEPAATGPVPGARFTGRNQHPARGEWTTTSTVTAVDPERLFGWAVGDPDHPAASWRFELTPEGSGTRLRHWARMGPGPSGITPLIEKMPDKEERIIAGRLEEWRRNMTATVEGIKALAEGRS